MREITEVPPLHMEGTIVELLWLLVAWIVEVSSAMSCIFCRFCGSRRRLLCSAIELLDSHTVRRLQDLRKAGLPLTHHWTAVRSNCKAAVWRGDSACLDDPLSHFHCKGVAPYGKTQGGGTSSKQHDGQERDLHGDEIRDQHRLRTSVCPSISICRISATSSARISMASPHPSTVVARLSPSLRS